MRLYDGTYRIDVDKIKTWIEEDNAAWVKGKVEWPYSFIREVFWRGYG